MIRMVIVVDYLMPEASEENGDLEGPGSDEVVESNGTP